MDVNCDAGLLWLSEGHEKPLALPTRKLFLGAPGMYTFGGASDKCFSTSFGELCGGSFGGHVQRGENSALSTA